MATATICNGYGRNAVASYMHPTICKISKKSVALCMSATLVYIVY